MSTPVVNWVPPVHRIGGIVLSPYYPEIDPCMPWTLIGGGFKKTPHFNTDFQETAARIGNGSTSFMPYPTWDFSLDLAVLTGSESAKYTFLQNLLSVFMQVRGRGGLFWFTDPNDNAVTDQTGLMLNTTPGAAAPMGTNRLTDGTLSTVGDGVSTVFQLARSIGQAVDILQNVRGPVDDRGIAGDITVYIDGAPTTAFSVSSTGLLTFTTAPANNALLTWEGNFRHLCRFTEDTVKDLGRVNKNSDGFLWSASSIEFQSEFV